MSIFRNISANGMQDGRQADLVEIMTTPDLATRQGVTFVVKQARRGGVVVSGGGASGGVGGSAHIVGSGGVAYGGQGGGGGSAVGAVLANMPQESMVTVSLADGRELAAWLIEHCVEPIGEVRQCAATTGEGGELMRCALDVDHAGSNNGHMSYGGVAFQVAP